MRYIILSIFFVTLVTFWTAEAQEVDSIVPVTTATIVRNAPLSAILDAGVRHNGYLIVTIVTPLSVFMISEADLRKNNSTVAVRNVTIAQDSSPSIAAIEDAVYMFGFQHIYRLNISRALQNATERFNASSDVKALKFERPAGQDPIPIASFVYKIDGKDYVFFVGGALNENTGFREIIRLDPSKYDDGVGNCTQVININNPNTFRLAALGSSLVALLSVEPTNSSRNEIALFDPISSTVLRKIHFDGMDASYSKSFVFDEQNNVVFIGGDRLSVPNHPFLYRINLTLTTDESVMYSPSDQADAAISAIQLSNFNERVQSVAMDSLTGTVFAALKDFVSASIVRVNAASMQLIGPDIPLLQSRRYPSFLLVDPLTRFLYAGLELDVVSFQYPTACPGQCFEYFGSNHTVYRKQGQCVAGECVCELSYRGEACDQRACASDCGGPLQGTCNNARCICEARWTGENCTTPRCPNDCSGNGICQTLANDTLECNCTGTNFVGEDCSQFSFCSSLSTVNACVLMSGCGWCQNTTSCHAGNASGPLTGQCTEWIPFRAVPPMSAPPTVTPGSAPPTVARLPSVSAPRTVSQSPPLSPPLGTVVASIVVTLVVAAAMIT